MRSVQYGYIIDIERATDRSVQRPCGGTKFKWRGEMRIRFILGKVARHGHIPLVNAPLTGGTALFGVTMVAAVTSGSGAKYRPVPGH